jgi:putative ABC transport system permease protein
VSVPLSYNLRNLAVRRLSTLSAAVGIGLVVAVFILVLALAFGFAYALQTAGSPLNAIVIRGGATAEVQSGIERDDAEGLAIRPEIAKDEEGHPIVVSDVVVLIVMPRKMDGAAAQVLIRGTGENAVKVHEGVRFVEGGRMFRPGLPELVVGKALSERIRGLQCGSTVTFKRREWKVVGIFETGGTGFESEIWADVGLVQSVFNREGVYQSVTFRMADPRRFQELKAAIESDPKYEVEVRTEAQYYSEQAGTLSTFIGILGTLITIIMSVGAVFGAMNTMYAAVGSRSREIATLRALGFGRLAILVSFLIESVVLAAMGGVLGCLFALPLNGLTTSTINWDTFSELAFAFRVTPEILGAGFLFAIVMGAVGGLLPALRAARTPIILALRQN